MRSIRTWRDRLGDKSDDVVARGVDPERHPIEVEQEAKSRIVARRHL
jgi:hypothetical protein